jgi:hypothetical protein
MSRAQSDVDYPGLINNAGLTNINFNKSSEAEDRTIIRPAILWLLMALTALSPQVGNAQQNPLRKILPCSQIVKTAVTAVPPPFNEYMRLECEIHMGQGLIPTSGFSWEQDGVSIGLTALDSRGDLPPLNPRGELALSYYTALRVIDVPISEKLALKAALRKMLEAKFLEHSSVIEMEATTSNSEHKQIYLLLPTRAGAFDGTFVGMECNTHCLPIDEDPFIFLVVPQGG